MNGDLRIFFKTSGLGSARGPDPAGFDPKPDPAGFDPVSENPNPTPYGFETSRVGVPCPSLVWIDRYFINTIHEEYIKH